MEIGNNFSCLASYNAHMAKGLEDKLFFLDKINFDETKHYVFVDYGCADGTLINAMYEIMLLRGISAYFIGYDISECMIDCAKAKFDACTNTVLFTSSWHDVERQIEEWRVEHGNDTLYRDKKILILSSLIHEVYSYAKAQDDINLFWNRVHGDYDYICVRDMMCSKSMDRKALDHDINIVIFGAAQNGLTRYLREYQEKYGVLTTQKDVIHFLLKYRWIINWNRELNENYFPIYIEDFLNKMMEDGCELSYIERFRVPFLDDCWQRDFGIKVFDYTHIKAIFEPHKN